MSKALMLEDPDDVASAARQRVIVVANNQLLRDALEIALTSSAGLEVVVSAETLDDLRGAAVQASLARVLLMAPAPLRETTIDQIRDLLAGYPDLKIVIIDAVHTGSDLLELLEAGASGVLLKRATMEEIRHATWAVLDGATVIPQALTRSLLSMIAEHAEAPPASSGWTDWDQVTRREQQIVALIAEGLSNKEIAATLNIATFTVKSHVHNVLQKLGLQTRAQIARSFLLARSTRPRNGAPYAHRAGMRPALCLAEAD
jgi:DNA-binding NarL/FixJ family response regulator